MNINMIATFTSVALLALGSTQSNASGAPEGNNDDNIPHAPVAAVAPAAIVPVIAPAPIVVAPAPVAAPAVLPANFVAAHYLALHADLTAAALPMGIPARVAFAGNHYLLFGFNEGRTFVAPVPAVLPAHFNAANYLALNPDLAAIAAAMAPAAQLAFAGNHYLLQGFNEARHF